MTTVRPAPCDEDAMQAVREGRLMIDQYDEWLIEEFRSHVGQRILEIGCGLGNLARHFGDRELFVGIDLSGDCVDRMNREFAGRGNCEFHSRNITDPMVLGLAHKKFDTIISLNVFEHIEQDELGLRHAWELLEPGGRGIIIVPAHQGLYGTMDASIGHCRRYTKASLREKMSRAGFRIIEQKYINVLGAVGWAVNGMILKRRVPPTGQLKLFNRLVPFLRAVEQRIPMPFGISVMTIGGKAAGSPR